MTGAFVLVGWQLWFPKKPIPAELPRLAALAEMIVMIELSLMCCDEDEFSADYLLDLMSEVIRSCVRTVGAVRARRQFNGLDDALLSEMPPSPVEVGLSMYRFQGTVKLTPSQALGEFINLACSWVCDAAVKTGDATDCMPDFAQALKYRMTAILDSRIVTCSKGSPNNLMLARPGTELSELNLLQHLPSDLGTDFEYLIKAFENDVMSGAWDGIIECMMRSYTCNIVPEESA